MHLRILLLTMAAGLFAAAWAGDRPQRDRPLVTSPGGGPDTAAPQGRARPADGAAVAIRAPRSVPPRQAEPAEIALDALWLWGACGIPLPPELAPGEYRVVGSDGSVRSLSLTAADIIYLGAKATEVPHDLSVVDRGPQTWYFIRVDGNGPALQYAATRATAETGADARQPAAVARQPAADAAMLAACFAGAARCIDCGRLLEHARMACWRCDGVCKRSLRRVTAVRRRTAAWADAMTETLQQSVRRIDWSSRLSAAPEGPTRL